jgi:hypothetical protein
MFIMHSSNFPRSLMVSESLRVIWRLCWYRNCRSEVVHVGVKYDIRMCAFSKSGGSKPDSSCMYLTLMRSNFPASLLVKIESLKY